MKIIKKVFAALLALPVLAGFVACTEEADYDAATVQKGNAQVYFSKNDGSVALVDGQSSFDVNVYRQDSVGELTVNLLKTDESGLFSAPESVTFADGEKMTSIPVTFDFSQLAADTEYPVTFKLMSDSTYYGPNELTYNVKYAPWSEWTEFGKGAYTYVQYFGGTYAAPMYYRESLVNNTQAQFWYRGDVHGGVSYIIDYNKETHELSVNEQHVADNANYGAVNIADSYYYWSVVRGDTEITKEDVPSFYDPETGLFSLCVVYYVSAGYFGDGYEYFQLDGFTQYDYSVQLSVGGNYTADDGTMGKIVHIKKGANIANVRYAYVSGSLTDETVQEVYDNLFYETIEYTETSEDGYKLILVPEDGDYAIAAIGYDEEGEAKGYAYANFTYESKSPWVSLGYCQYTDDLFAPLFEAPVPTYSVEIFEHSEKPGLYRMKDAYGANYPYNETEEDYLPGTFYIEIDATDPSAVFINHQSMGIDWGYGEAFIYSYASYNMDSGYAKEDVAAAGLFGTLKDGVITFPVKGMLVGMGENLYYGNNSGEFKIDMTNLTSAPADNSGSSEIKSRDFSGNTSGLKHNGVKKQMSIDLDSKVVRNFIQSNIIK